MFIFAVGLSPADHDQFRPLYYDLIIFHPIKLNQLIQLNPHTQPSQHTQQNQLTRPNQRILLSLLTPKNQFIRRLNIQKFRIPTDQLLIQRMVQLARTEQHTIHQLMLDTRLENSYIKPSVPDSLMWVGPRSRQVCEFRSLTRLRYSRMWIRSKCRATVLLRYIEYGKSVISNVRLKLKKIKATNITNVM